MRRHPLRAIVDMTLAMYLPFVVLFVPYWMSLLSAGSALGLGHVLMLPAMAVAMVCHGDRHGRDHGTQGDGGIEAEEVAA
jgi:hypothetical protein